MSPKQEHVSTVNGLEHGSETKKERILNKWCCSNGTGTHKNKIAVLVGIMCKS